MQTQETQDTMTLAKAIEAIESLLEAFAWRSGGGDGKIVAEAVRALEFLKEFQQEWEVYYTEEVAGPVYELTRKAMECNNSEEVRRILLQFERIIEDGCYLPIQKCFLLWESSVISLEQLIIFLESAYKLASKLRGKNEAVRWMANLLWRLTRC